jgi:hypothetical protein
MKRVALVLLILVALTTARGFSAEVTGKWAGGKSVALVFTFQQDGTKLTGEVQATPMPGADPIVLPISDGRIDGNRLSFAVTLGEQLKLLCDGIVNGDEIHMNSKAEGPGFSGGNSTVLKKEN